MQTQLALFGEDVAEESTLLVTPNHINYGMRCDEAGPGEVAEVPGLKFIEGFLALREQAACVEKVDAAIDEWRHDLARRVQHYGWRYDYKARAITPDMHLGALPDWLFKLAVRLYDETGQFDRVPEQVIVNEYEPGQGIAMHIDHPGFGPTVCTISLLDDWEMDFSKDWKHKQPALLQRGSCVLLTGASRSKWQHGIAPRKSELLAIGRRDRKRRLSLTFRTVVNRDGPND